MRRRLHFVRHSAELKAHVKNTASQYNLPAIDINLRQAAHRETIRSYFPDISAQASVTADLDMVDHYDRTLQQMELHILKQAKNFQPLNYRILTTIPGIGKVLALTILFEVGDIERFPTVKQFASYARLIKCQAESAGKMYGTQGNKIGNAHLKWAFSEAAVLFLKGNPAAKQYLARLQKRMSKAKALSVLAHKLGRCAYHMLKTKTVFDESRVLG